MRRLIPPGLIGLLLVSNTCAPVTRNPSAQPDQEVEAAAVVAFTEGPAVDTAGNVFFSELANKRIMKLSPSAGLSVFRENSNAANGLIFDQQGRLLACEGNPDNARVTRTDLKTGQIEVLADHYEGKRLCAPNDLTIDNQGRVYFTDMRSPNSSPDKAPTAGVYRIDPDGKIARILAEPDIQVPNGISISPDDKILYLVESNQKEGGARMIRAYDLQSDGSVRNMRVFHNFYPGRSADGLCMDTQGTLYAAAGLHGRRGTSETLDTKCGIHVFTPGGALKRFIPIPEDTLTNCAFGGPDMKTLYVTAGKTLWKIQNDVPGTRR
jgi:gluconolactonase